MATGARWTGSRAHEITSPNLFDPSVLMRLARCITPSCVVEEGGDDVDEAKLGVVDPSWTPVEGVVGTTAIGFDVEVVMSNVVGAKVVGCVEVVGVVEGVEVDSIVVATGAIVVSSVGMVGATVLGSAVLGAAVLGAAVLGAAVLGAAVLGAAVLGAAVLGALWTGRSLDSGQIAGTMPMRPTAMSKMISL